MTLFVRTSNTGFTCLIIIEFKAALTPLTSALVPSVGIRDCLTQRKLRVGRFLKHHRDLLDVVLGAENLLGCQVDDSRTHVNQHRHANDASDR